MDHLTAGLILLETAFFAFVLGQLFPRVIHQKPNHEYGKARAISAAKALRAQWKSLRDDITKTGTIGQRDVAALRFADQVIETVAKDLETSNEVAKVLA